MSKIPPLQLQKTDCSQDSEETLGLCKFRRKFYVNKNEGFHYRHQPLGWWSIKLTRDRWTALIKGFQKIILFVRKFQFNFDTECQTETSVVCSYIFLPQPPPSPHYLFWPDEAQLSWPSHLTVNFFQAKPILTQLDNLLNYMLEML